jgi:hypothetical protein
MADQKPSPTAFVLVDGDTVSFDLPTGVANISQSSTTISGSGKALSSGGKASCVAGDETKVSLDNVTYSTSTFTGGEATLSISGLSTDQTASVLRVGGLQAILVGSRFTAIMRVTTPATNPSLPATDPNYTDKTTSYAGTGTFTTANKILASR